MHLPAEIVELIASKDRRIAELEAASPRPFGAWDWTVRTAPNRLERRFEEEAAPGPKPARPFGQGERGQEGHKGDTLRQVAKPDLVVAHTACVCEHCRLPLGPNSAISVEKRQVFDLSERPLLVADIEPRSTVANDAEA